MEPPLMILESESGSRLRVGQAVWAAYLQCAEQGGWDAPFDLWMFATEDPQGDAVPPEDARELAEALARYLARDRVPDGLGAEQRRWRDQFIASVAELMEFCREGGFTARLACA